MKQATRTTPAASPASPRRSSTPRRGPSPASWASSWSTSPAFTCCGAGDIHEARPEYYLHLNARILGQAEQLGPGHAADDLQRLHAQPAAGQQEAPRRRGAARAGQRQPARGGRRVVRRRRRGAAPAVGDRRGRRLREAEGDRLQGPLDGLKIAPFYGCQILRPRSCWASRILTVPSRSSGSSRPAAPRRSTTPRRSSAAASRSCWRARRWRSAS